ncbi:hypothetical protein EDF60_1225 [Leucobacter luti]|nr:hypothetical protein [Leucobacter luti]TCK45986.1 hypothetical protein EDF60_1225 [Leucobacter luti]
MTGWQRPARAGGATPSGRAGKLAAELERRCINGITLREHGRCVAIVSGTVRSRKRHRRRGHDAGCRAVGIPLSRIMRFLRARDSVGVAPLLAEAAVDAITEIDAWGSRWEARAAREAVSDSIRRRITPRSAAQPRP